MSDDGKLPQDKYVMNWENIYREYSPGILQYLCGLCGTQSDAQDLLQETFIKAMRSESSLREPGKMRSWLMTIARNLFLDSRRKWVNKNITTVADDNPILEVIPDPGHNPEKFAVQSDFKAKLHKILAELSETLQTAFTLAVIQKLSYAEIEEITGWSMSMVKTNVFRARRKIASELSEFR